MSGLSLCPTVEPRHQVRIMHGWIAPPGIWYLVFLVTALAPGMAAGVFNRAANQVLLWFMVSCEYAVAVVIIAFTDLFLHVARVTGFVPFECASPVATDVRVRRCGRPGSRYFGSCRTRLTSRFLSSGQRWNRGVRRGMIEPVRELETSAF